MLSPRRQSLDTMMSPGEVTLAVVALLATPGPTNTLMMIAGAERGLAGASRLIPAELAGYLTTILPLVLARAALQAVWPGLHAAVTVTAAVWVAVLAIRPWRPVDKGAADSVDARSLFVTTALNPKALIFGLAILPSPDSLGPNLAIFAALVLAVAVAWAAVGAALRDRGQGQPRVVQVLRRLASVWLGAVSVVLMIRGVGA
jgi:threonine/homoserine/homoserine lactone efflux protein